MGRIQCRIVCISQGRKKNLGFLKKVFRLLGFIGFIGFLYKDGTRQYDPKAHENKGGATVLKVGGTILRAERAKKFF